MVLGGCDAETTRLERALASAHVHHAAVARSARRIERTSAAQLRMWIAGVERRLPNAGLRAFTATAAAVITDIDGAAFSKPPPPHEHGATVTEPVMITVPARLEAVLNLTDRIAANALPWQLDGWQSTQSGLRVSLHGYAANAAALAATATAALAPSPDDGHPGRDALRAKIRETLARATAASTPLLRRLLVAEKKNTVLIDLDRRAGAAKRDLETLLAILIGVEILPPALAFVVRRGRRLCTITVATDFERVRIAGEALRRGTAIDAARTELVLPSGRTCALVVRHSGSGRPGSSE